MTDLKKEVVSLSVHWERHSQGKPAPGGEGAGGVVGRGGPFKEGVMSEEICERSKRCESDEFKFS